MPVTTYPQPVGAPQSEWQVSVDGEPTWTHYTTRGSTATVSSSAVAPLVVQIAAPTKVTAVEVVAQQPGVWPAPTIDATFVGKLIRFTLPAGFHGHLLVKINNAAPPDWDNWCSLAFLPVETDAPDPETVTHYFGPGTHTGAPIRLYAGQSVYVAGGAYLNRRVMAGIWQGGPGQMTDVRIFGRGVIDTNNGYGPTDQGLGTCEFVGVDNLTITGVTIAGRYGWCAAALLCRNVVVDWTRIYSCEILDAASYAGQGTPDGFDALACQGFTLRRSLISASDDSSAIKADKYGHVGDCTGHLYEDLLLMQGGKSNGVDIGYENGTRTVSGVTYRRVVLAECWRDTEPYRTAPLGIHVPSAATIDGVLYEDIDIRTIDVKDYGLFVGTWYSSSLSYSLPGSENRGLIRNIVYRRVHWPANPPKFRIASEAPDKRIGVRFEDCTIGGQPLTGPLPGWEIINADVEYATTPPGDDLQAQIDAVVLRVADVEHALDRLAGHLAAAAADLTS